MDWDKGVVLGMTLGPLMPFVFIDKVNLATAFDIFDRYDYAAWFAVEVLVGVALVLWCAAVDRPNPDGGRGHSVLHPPLRRNDGSLKDERALLGGNARPDCYGASGPSWASARLRPTQSQWRRLVGSSAG